MVEVIATDEFVDWYDNLQDSHLRNVTRTVDMLEMSGVTLGFPQSSKIKGSRYPLRELRIKSGGHQLRVFYAFDPKRRAVLLLGGDKTGDDRFYQRFIPTAERLWEEYLDETGE